MEQQVKGAAGDEISLVDLFLILNRRKWLVAVLLLLGVVIAAAYAVSQRKLIAYTTSLEIGTLLISDSKDSEELTTIDTVENLTAKIKQAYIPLLESKRNGQVKIDVESPRKSNLLILKSVSGEPGQLDYYSGLHSELLALIQQDELERINEMSAMRVSKTRIVGKTMEEELNRKSQNLLLMSVLGAFLGLFLGVFSAFVAEFISNVRNELKGSKVVAEA